MNTINGNQINILKRTVYKFNLIKEEVDTFDIEHVRLFDDLTDLFPQLAKYTMTVYSPRNYYYTSLLNSGILTVDEAWKLYIDISKEQVDNDFKLSQKEILDMKTMFYYLYKKCLDYYIEHNFI